MQLIYLNKNHNSYSIISQHFPSLTCEIGQKNKRGQTLLYAILVLENKIFILNSWRDYDEVYNRVYKIGLFGRIKNFKTGVKNKIAYKLIDLAYKIKR